MRQKNTATSLVAGAFSIFFLVSTTSCVTSKKINTNYLYFENGADTIDIQQKETAIQTNDLLSIRVFSQTLNQEQTAIFNITASNMTNPNSEAQGYEVNLAGNIVMPVIGDVKAAGLTKEELQTILVQKLSNYVKNPSVIVRFQKFNVNVLGEVKNPGSKKFIGDRVTVIDALSEAGDLTDFGKRENIIVIREEKGKKIYHKIDLRDKAIFNSPVYMLQQNDIVYVSPNKYKLKSLDIDPAVQRRNGVIFALVSIGLSALSIVLIYSR